MFTATGALRQASTSRTPLIRFLGKRSIPDFIDSEPRVHPASSTQKLPSEFTSPSFSSYRQQAQQHGPLGRMKCANNRSIGSTPASSLGPITPAKGEFFDRSELPTRFQRVPIELTEIDAIETGGATLTCHKASEVSSRSSL